MLWATIVVSPLPLLTDAQREAAEALAARTTWGLGRAIRVPARPWSPAQVIAAYATSTLVLVDRKVLANSGGLASATCSG